MNRLRSVCSNLIISRTLRYFKAYPGTGDYTNFIIREACFSKYSTKAKETKETEEILDDIPIKYSASPASKHRAETSRTGVYEPRLWYEPYVIMASVAIFLIYFTILREENDIDEELDTSLYSRIKGLEELQLKLSLAYNRQHGLDTADIIKRLEEIEKQKQITESDTRALP